MTIVGGPRGSILLHHFLGRRLIGEHDATERGPTESSTNLPSPADAAIFAVAELATGELAGEALLWGIDLHNRSAHLGLALRPACRGRGLGEDTVRVLCRYGFALRGLHRLQLETLTDNHAMIAAAEHVGFTREGAARASSWVNGQWADDVIFGLLDTEFTG